jgi:carbon storage regulator
VVDVRGKTVKLGFLFPQDATILRKELHQKILEQNLAAANVDESELLNVEFQIEGNRTPDDPAKDDKDGNR